MGRGRGGTGQREAEEDCEWYVTRNQIAVKRYV